MTDEQLSDLFVRTIVPDCRDANNIDSKFAISDSEGAKVHQAITVGF